MTALLSQQLRQYDLDFTPDLPAPRPSLPPRLLILACSATKSPGEGLTARDRYNGPLWQTLKATDPDSRMAAVAYLSAKYGLGDARTPLPDYNSLLTRQAAASMIERGLCGFYPHSMGRAAPPERRDILQTGALAACRLQRAAGRPFQSVAICGGRHYVEVGTALVDEMRAHGFIATDAPVTVINDQIGFMRAKLRTWLQTG